jgi:MinD-like ATPase involved in chromosome partitioning or flagellar assembly
MTQPKITAFLDSTGQTNVTDPDGKSHERAFADLPSARRAVREAAAKHAAEHGVPVELEITDPSGLHALLVHADGDTELIGGDLPVPVRDAAAGSRFQPAPAKAPTAVPAHVAEPVQPAQEPTAEESPVVEESAAVAVEKALTRAPAAKMPSDERARPGRGSDLPSLDLPHLEEPARVVAPVGAESPAPALPSRKSLRDADAQSFVRADVVVEPAVQGWRGVLNNLVPSLSLAPGEAERLEREWVRLVARHYALTRTVAVINQKGGPGKTMTTTCLAAVFGRSGGSVLAWDNNETSGSLGDRTERGDHGASALDVLTRAAHLLSDASRAADINAFVHRQITDRYDVLRSDSDLLGTHEVTADEVDTLHAVASKFFNVLLMDSGNNHRAGNWNRMIDHADQLVVPVTINDDDVHKGLLTLKGLALRGDRTAELASQAVVIVSQKAPGQHKDAENTAAQFAEYVRETVIIPYDPALVSGVIRFGALQPATRLAWLKAAAAVAKGL